MRAASDKAARSRRFRRCVALPCVSTDDLSILRFVGEQHLIDDAQLTRLRGRSLNTNRAWRRKYREAGLLASSELLPHMVCSWLTQAGLDFCGLDWRYLKPSTGRLEHTVAVGNVRIDVEAKLKDQGKEFVWVSERQLAKEIAKGEHMPDGEVLLGDGKTVAVEVELTLKRKERMRRIFVELLGNYNAVWAWCADAPRRQLETIVKEYGWQKVQIIALADEPLPARRAAHAPSQPASNSSNRLITPKSSSAHRGQPCNPSVAQDCKAKLTGL